MSLLMFDSTTGIAQSPPPDSRFGIVEVYVNPAAVGEGGTSYTRIIFRWDLIWPDGPGDRKPANVSYPPIEGELAARYAVSAGISTPAPQPSLRATPAIFTPTPTSPAVVQNQSTSPSPQPVSTPLPPISPLTVLTPARCLILIIVGMVVFTITYGLQAALWWRQRK